MSFAEIYWWKKHSWLLVKSDRVYCLYCSHSHTCARNKTGIFLIIPFIGVHPDKLVKHEKSATHQLCADDYREFERWQASSEIMHRSCIHVVTVDERAFQDSLKCMYWLPKSLFSPLLDLCVHLGNELNTSVKEGKKYDLQIRTNKWGNDTCNRFLH